MIKRNCMMKKKRQNHLKEIAVKEDGDTHKKKKQ